jgi:hypothetical protein
MRPSEIKTFDCVPTLSDLEVLDFCKNGYLLLEGVVDHQVNRRTREFLDEHPTSEPTEILQEDWFVEAVLMNPAAADTVRSLLGAGFHMPVLMSNHRVQCPVADVGGWHVDGNYDFKRELNYLQVFYYPQDTPVEMGPTQVLAGSHLIHNKARFMSHYGSLRGQIPTAAPEGSIFITAYQIWHRRGPSTAAGLRNMLKYFYWRTTPPQRDWVVDPEMDFSTLKFSGPGNKFCEQFRADIKTAELFLWTCGFGNLFQNLGGQSWPLPANRSDFPYGFPAGLNR